MTVDPITWERLRAIFGNPQPVLKVTEQQFDGFDGTLMKLGRTPYDQIDFFDMGLYHHDLAYVQLQPELFAYLFPVCLMDWHQTLLANEECAHGDSEFHYGIVQGNILEKMLGPLQRTQVSAVFRDSMLYRMDLERWPTRSEEAYMAAGAWVARLNSLGLFSDALPEIWDQWWNVKSVGRAVCVLEYCSDLMYFADENPIFRRLEDGRIPVVALPSVNDARLFETAWTEANLAYVIESVTKERVINVVRKAAEVLAGRPCSKIASTIVADLDERLELIESRVLELPRLLTQPCSDDWLI